MAKNPWEFEIPESWLKIQETLRELTDPVLKLNFEISQYSWQKEISGITAALQSLQPCLDSFSGATENMAMLSRISELQISLQRMIPDYSQLLISAEKIIPQISKMPTIDWEWMSSALQGNENKYDTVEAQSIITPEIQKELDESVQQVLSEASTDEAVKSRFIQWQKKNPVLAFIFLNIIIVILTNLVSSFAYDWISAKLNRTSNVYEEPRASSSVVINVNVENEIIIINSVPYYYQVVYTDPETGEEYTGYVSKKNVEPESIEPVDPSETESTSNTQ